MFINMSVIRQHPRSLLKINPGTAVCARETILISAERPETQQRGRLQAEDEGKLKKDWWVC